MTVTKSEGLSEKLQIAIVAVLSIGVCALLFYFHTVRETSAVVTHFFYIPIILAALWWREKGLFVALLLAMILIFNRVFISQDIMTTNDYLRAGMFVVIALVVSTLSKRISRGQKGIEKEQKQLKSVFEASMDAIIAVDKRGRIILFNQSAEELFQYSSEEVINQPVKMLLRGDAAHQHQERLDKFLTRGDGKCGHIGRRSERMFKRKDGTFFEAELAMSGGRSDGEALIVVSIHDITERKQVNRRATPA